MHCFHSVTFRRGGSEVSVIMMLSVPNQFGDPPLIVLHCGFEFNTCWFSKGHCCDKKNQVSQHFSY